jgi:hypothetical protein
MRQSIDLVAEAAIEKLDVGDERKRARACRVKDRPKATHHTLYALRLRPIEDLTAIRHPERGFSPASARHFTTSSL